MYFADPKSADSPVWGDREYANSVDKEIVRLGSWQTGESADSQSRQTQESGDARVSTRLKNQGHTQELLLGKAREAHCS